MGAIADRASVDAPARLVAENRVEFRAAVLDCLQRSATAGVGHLRIDMSGTEDIDASGLGTLVVLQKRARERGLVTVLCGTQPRVRSLLATTRLEALFEFAA